MGRTIWRCWSLDWLMGNKQARINWFQIFVVHFHLKVLYATGTAKSIHYWNRIYRLFLYVLIFVNRAENTRQNWERSVRTMKSRLFNKGKVTTKVQQRDEREKDNCKKHQNKIRKKSQKNVRQSTQRYLLLLFATSSLLFINFFLCSLFPFHWRRSRPFFRIRMLLFYCLMTADLTNSCFFLRSIRWRTIKP